VPPLDGALAGIETVVEVVGCYSGLYSEKVRVLKPATECQLERIFAHAAQNNLRVTIRGGGHSFDAQSIGDDLVVSMQGWNTIDPPDMDAQTIRVGPGATWGSILRALQPHGLVPAVTVTTQEATAAGTLAGNCLSRFSPAHGKTGSWIESFDLLTPSGARLTCSPDGGDPDAERAFAAAVGGLGWLGAVTSITYRLLAPADAGAPIAVRTELYKHRTLQDLSHDLVPHCKRTVEEHSDSRNPDMLDAIWSALHLRKDGKASALLFTSTYEATAERRRLSIHRPLITTRILVEWLMRINAMSSLIFRFGLRFLFKEHVRYIDDLDGFTFFMDGNVRAKRCAKKYFNCTLRNVQQTFIVPVSGTSRGWDTAADDLAEWVQHAHGFLRERKLKPTMLDILFVPQEKSHFFLSATADEPGFAVSYTFETSRSRVIKRAQEAFRDLSDTLWEDFGGRVYLVKHVYARETTIAQMYGHHAEDFMRLKAQLDPHGILRNKFLERTFHDVMSRAYAERLETAA
jgi:decaprenylphospho-beta-D-ribofuranose 2-oxidase